MYFLGLFLVSRRYRAALWRWWPSPFPSLWCSSREIGVTIRWMSPCASSYVGPFYLFPRLFVLAGNSTLTSRVWFPLCWRELVWIGATVNIGWSRAEDDSAVYSILEDCVAAITEYAQTMGVYGSFQFLNDAFQSQQPLQSYGTGSYGKLKSASLQYDPSGVFQHLVPGGFKLWMRSGRGHYS